MSPAALKSSTGLVTTSRAAQYLRMSTDSQKYSIENQAAAIAAYAARRQINIVRTFTDQGRSGLRIIGRDGLQELIKDVQFGRPDFDSILVYDVSRWGRFQDVDESAYYEFICKRAGIIIHYCADEFENDGSLASTILKNIKRVAAADYSRQLSKRVFLGQCHVVGLGYWRGGPAGYGLRRLLVGEDGRAKSVLEYGERKNLKSEHVILVPGPKSEVNIVRRIFRSFAVQKKTRTEIANALNADRIPNARGKPWSMLTVSNTLKNEAYVGHLVYNRRSMKLGERNVRNPPEMWIRRDNAIKPIVAPELFAKAQKSLAELDYGRTRTDEDVLNRLRTLFRRKGHLSAKIMQEAKDVPDYTVYARRFGSLVNAYKMIGFKPNPRYGYKETGEKIDRVICSVIDDLISDLERRGRSASFLHELYLLTVDRNLTIVVAVAWSVGDGMSGIKHSRRWEVRKIKYKRSDLTLVVRMDTANARIQDYFLLPTANLPLTRGKKIRISNRLFGEFGYSTFDALVGALHERVKARRSKLHPTSEAKP